MLFFLGQIFLFPNSLLLLIHILEKRNNEKTNFTIMKFNWNETVIWLCLLSFVLSSGTELISDYTGIDSWSIIYFSIGLLSVAVLILIYRIILKFKKNK